MNPNYSGTLLSLCFLLALASCAYHAGPVDHYYKKNGDVYRRSKIYGYPNGKRSLAQVDLWKNDWLVETKVYYELWPNYEWKFVSKSGFITVKDGVNLLNNDTVKAPDNIIYKYFDRQYVEQIEVYKDGKRIKYTLGYPDGHRTMEYLRKPSGVYNWKDGKEYFEREFTPEEIEGNKRFNEQLNKKTKQDSTLIKDK